MILYRNGINPFSGFQELWTLMSEVEKYNNVVMFSVSITKAVDPLSHRWFNQRIKERSDGFSISPIS